MSFTGKKLIVLITVLLLSLCIADLKAQNSTDTIDVYDSDSVLIKKCNGGPFSFCQNCDYPDDRFCFEYTGNDPYKMIIYYRWGKEIFLTEDKEECWNGKREKTLFPAGTYFFMLK